jgi:succinate dehydrogenase / fumarate reductase flavoprotein subunit
LSDDIRTPAISTEDEQFEKAEKEAKNRVNKLLNNNGNRSVESFHRELGKVVWDHCGMSRNKNGLEKAIETIKDLKAEFWTNVSVPGEENVINPELAKAGRVADFIELGELMMRDALARDESCGGHFREEHQTDEGEALRDDTNFAFTSAWEFSGEKTPPQLNKETLEFENVQLTQRSYK